MCPLESFATPCSDIQTDWNKEYCAQTLEFENAKNEYNFGMLTVILLYELNIIRRRWVENSLWAENDGWW